MGNARFEPAFDAHPAQLGCEATLIASDNLRAAMRDDCSRYALFRAPTELRADSSMPDEPMPPLANERARECRAVANVKLHILQPRRARMNEKKIRPIKNARSARVDAVSDGRRKDRMFDRERLKCNTADLRWIALFDQLAIVDLTASQRSPRLLRRVHRTGSAISQSPGVIRMRVCKHDRAGTQPLKFSQPIKAAINHHIGPAVADEQ